MRERRNHLILVSLILAALIGVGLYLVFRRLGWTKRAIHTGGDAPQRRSQGAVELSAHQHVPEHVERMTLNRPPGPVGSSIT